MNVVVYTDASYCDNTKIAACGFVVILNGKMVKHTVEIVEGLSDIGVSESYALAQGLQWAFLVNGVKTITAFTDRYSLIQLAKANIVRPKTKKRHQEYLETMDIISEYGVEFTINFVKGHSGDRYNTMVDKSCNINLKEYLKQQRA